MTDSTTSAWGAIEQRLSTIKKPTSTYKLCPDPDLRDRHQEAQEKADGVRRYLEGLPKSTAKDARSLAEKELAAAQAELAQVQEEYDAAVVTLTFQALERQQLAELQKKHPPLEEDEERNLTGFHWDTFAPALISAASVDGMPLDYAVQAMQTWTLTDAQDLWNAAWGVQQRRRTDLGKG